MKRHRESADPFWYPKRRASHDPLPMFPCIIQGLKPSRLVALARWPPGNSVRVLALGVRLVVFDEAAVAVVVFLVVRRRHPAHAICTPRRLDAALGCLLRDGVTCIDPVGVHVDGRTEVVDVGLEGLAADFTLQVADTRLLLDGDADGLFVVAEETLEGGREFLLLQGC